MAHREVEHAKRIAGVGGLLEEPIGFVGVALAPDPFACADAGLDHGGEVAAFGGLLDGRIF